MVEGELLRCWFVMAAGYHPDDLQQEVWYGTYLLAPVLPMRTSFVHGTCGSVWCNEFLTDPKHE